MYHRLERGFMPHSQEMERARGIRFERQADCIFAGVGQGAVAVGYVDGDEFSVRSFFLLRTVFFTVGRLTARHDVLARRSCGNKFFRHSVSPSTATIPRAGIARLMSCMLLRPSLFEPVRSARLIRIKRGSLAPWD